MPPSPEPSEGRWGAAGSSGWGSALRPEPSPPQPSQDQASAAVSLLGSRFCLAWKPSPCVHRKRARGFCLRGPDPAHPHVCGENVWALCRCGRYSPLHPCVCGENKAPLGREGEVQRYIPACAGETVRMDFAAAVKDGPSPGVRGKHPAGGWKGCAFPGHPRVCGGNLGKDRLGSCANTGHPRVCGGNISPGRSRPPGRPGHPRVCGGNAKAP